MKRHSLFKLAKRSVVALALLYLLIAVFLYFAQELFIFPLLRSKFNASINARDIPINPPAGVTTFFVDTPDGDSLDVWTTFAPGQKTQHVALIFHGNGETASSGNFLPFFKNLGIPAFTFDYRGYGRSTGWPSEKKLYADAETVWSEIEKRTGLKNDQLIILGNSIGSGPASYLANKVSPKALILLAAYSDFPSLISGMPAYAPFGIILRYSLPVKTYLRELNTKCLILAHGKRDQVIPFAHFKLNSESINPSIKPTLLVSEDAEHGNIFYKVEDRLKAAVQECVALN